jgi:hypothetical protein
MTRETRQAVRQALFCGAVVALVVAAALMVSHQPADADELRLPIAELRSQAAELELLRKQSSAAALTPRFARVQRQQLADAIDWSRDELTSMQVEPALLDARTTAIALAAQAAAAAHRPDAVLPTAPLQALEASLRR